MRTAWNTFENRLRSMRNKRLHVHMVKKHARVLSINQAEWSAKSVSSYGPRSSVTLRHTVQISSVPAHDSTTVRRRRHSAPTPYGRSAARSRRLRRCKIRAQRAVYTHVVLPSRETLARVAVDRSVTSGSPRTVYRRWSYHNATAAAANTRLVGHELASSVAPAELIPLCLVLHTHTR